MAEDSTPEQHTIPETNETLEKDESQDQAIRAGPSEPRPPTARDRPLLWLLPLALAQFICGGVYALFAVFVTSCGSDEFGPIGYASGGQPRSLRAAVALGALLWLAAGLALWRFPSWRRRILASTTAIYTAGLGLLWAITPSVWGAGICPGSAPAHLPGQIGSPLSGDTDIVGGVSFSPSGRILVSSSWDGTLRLWDVQGHHELGHPLWRYRDRIYGDAFSPDGRAVASAACDGTVRLWDVRTHKQLGSALPANTSTGGAPANNEGCVNAVAFSPDGRVLASGGSDGTVRFWNVRMHTELGRPLGNPDEDWFNSIAFSPDGRTLATGSQDGAVRLWDVGTYRQLRPPLRAGQTVEAVAFSPNGRLLASGDDGKAVRFWDVRTHRQLGAAFRGTDLVDDVAFSPNGRTLAACFDDGTLRLWDVHSRRELGHALHATASSIAFSPDGRILASGDSDGTIRLWDVRVLSGQTEPTR